MEFDPNKPFDVIEESKSIEFDPTQPFEKQDISMPESFLRGAASGVSFGLAPKVIAAGESALTNKTYEQSLAESERNFREAEETNPKSFLAGEIASFLVPGVLGRKAISKGASTVAGKASEGVKAAGKKSLEAAKKLDNAKEALVDKLATKLGTDNESIKDAAAVIADIAGAGGIATAGRVLSKGKKVKELYDIINKTEKAAEVTKTATKVAEPLAETVAKTVSKTTKTANKAEEAIVDKIANSIKGEAKPKVTPPTTVVPSKNVDIGSAKDLPFTLEKRIIGGKEIMVKKYKEGTPLYRSFE